MMHEEGMKNRIIQSLETALDSLEYIQESLESLKEDIQTKADDIRSIQSQLLNLKLLVKKQKYLSPEALDALTSEINWKSFQEAFRGK